MNGLLTIKTRKTDDNLMMMNNISCCHCAIRLRATTLDSVMNENCDCQTLKHTCLEQEIDSTSSQWGEVVVRVHT